VGVLRAIQAIRLRDDRINGRADGPAHIVAGQCLPLARGDIIGRLETGMARRPINGSSTRLRPRTAPPKATNSRR